MISIKAAFTFQVPILFKAVQEMLTLRFCVPFLPFLASYVEFWRVPFATFVALRSFFPSTISFQAQSSAFFRLGLHTFRRIPYDLSRMLVSFPEILAATYQVPL